jgi:hypothetical protein
MRVVDQFIVAWLMVFIAIGILFDSVLLFAGEGPISDATLQQLPHPVMVMNAWRRWTVIDPLMLANPVWLVAISWLNNGSLLFCLTAIPLIFTEDERIRSPALVWSGSAMTMIVIILCEEAVGPYRTSHFWLVVLAYVGYIITPLVVLLRFWNGPAFQKKKNL